MNQAIRTLEKEMQAGTEAEKAYLADYLENKAVPPEYLDYCRAWERAYLKWERLQEVDMKDLSLKTLKVYYECQNNGTMNSDFESDIRDLAKKYGLTFWASGLSTLSGIRDLVFKVEE